MITNQGLCFVAYNIATKKHLKFQDFSDRCKIGKLPDFILMGHTLFWTKLHYRLRFPPCHIRDASIYELFRGCLSSFCSLHIIYFTSNRIVLCNQRNIGENFLISWHCAKWHLIYLDYFPKQTTAFYLYWWKLHPLCYVLSCFVCLANIRGLQGISQNQVHFEW